MADSDEEEEIHVTYRIRHQGKFIARCVKTLNFLLLGATSSSFKRMKELTEWLQRDSNKLFD